MMRHVLSLALIFALSFGAALADGSRSHRGKLSIVTHDGVTLSGTGRPNSPLAVTSGSVMPAAHDHSTSGTGGTALRPTTLDITTSIRLPSTAPSAARQIAVTSGGDLQWHDGTAARGAARKDRTVTLIDANAGASVTFAGNAATLGGNVDITETHVFGTSANNFAMGSKTLTLANANSSFTFGSNGSAIGADRTLDITPTFGTTTFDFAEGDNTVTLVDANTGSSFTFGNNGQPIGANISTTLTPTFGTAANNFAMGSRTVTLANGDSSFTFGGNTSPIGANMTLDITPTFANPTGTVGATAVNGTSKSFMRADAAPALNQAGAYNFTALVGVTSQNITATTQFLSVGGSASAPGFSITTDLNTGVFSDTADTLQFSTAGSERARIKSDGEVLIGSTTDAGTYRLQVTGNLLAVANGQTAVFQSAGAGLGAGAVFRDISGGSTYSWFVGAQYNVSQGFEVTPSTAVGGTTFSAPLLKITTTTTIFNDGGDDIDLRIETNNDANALFVDGGTDRVGIGTAAPNVKLDVNGVIGPIGGVASAPAYTFSTDTNCGFARDAADTIKVITAGSVRQTWYSTGGVSIGAPTGGDKGAGTLNVDGDVYKDGTAYTNPDYVFERAYTGTIDKYANRPGAASYRPRSIDEMEDYTQRYHRFPGIKDTAMGVFERSDFVLERLEEQFLYIAQLNAENKDMKRRVTALERGE